MLNQRLASNHLYEILTPYGWEDFDGVIFNESANKPSFEIRTESGKMLRLTEEHRMFDAQDNEIKARDISIGTILQTEDGVESVIFVESIFLEDTYEIWNSESHTILANGFKSHQCDEFAFVRAHIQEEFWLSVSPTLATGGACIIASTPNGDNNLYATLYKGAELGANEFKYKHVPWDAPPNRDEAFKRTQIGLIGERKWKQEYECDFLSSDGNLIEGIVLAQITTLIKLKIKEERHIAFKLMDQDFFKPIERGATYLVMVDPATGSGEDFSVIQVFDFPKLEQVMEFRDNTSSTPKLYTRLKNVLNFLTAYGCTVHFTIENNGVGNGLISLYEVDETPPQANLMSETGKGKLGMTTTLKNKLKACIKLKEMIERGSIIINSETLAKELSNYVRREGSYAAQRGSTDDCVSTLLLMTRIIEEMIGFDMAAYNLMYSFESKNEWAETVQQPEVEGRDYFHMTPITSDYYK